MGKEDRDRGKDESPGRGLHAAPGVDGWSEVRKEKQDGKGGEEGRQGGGTGRVCGE
jgi:hypothetical protein